jgi:hypothetical protein
MLLRLRLVGRNPTERARGADEEALKEIDSAKQAVQHAIDEMARRQEELARVDREVRDNWYQFQNRLRENQLRDPAGAEPDSSCATTALVLGAVAGALARGGASGLNSAAAALDACGNR